SHPIMSRLQPKPIAFNAPVSPLNLKQAMGPQQALACHRVQEFQRLSVVSMQDSAYYRVATSDNAPARYFSVADCRELHAGDETYARQLASHYTGMPVSEINNARLITQFDEEYLPVNRLLPVWRVEFARSDHLRAYIDTDQSRLSTLIDDTRYVLGKVFRLGHNWAYLDGFPRMQLAVMAMVLSTAFFSAISGITLYVRRRRHSQERLGNQPGRRWHRRLGLLVALTTLTFAGSGMFHLLMSYQQQQAATAHIPAAISAATLSEEAWRQAVLHAAHRIDLVHSQEGLYWLLRNNLPPSRVAVMSHKDHHPSAHNSQSETLSLPADKLAANPVDVLSLARSQAARFAHLPELAIVKTELVTKFGGEYGFIFKRLPVVKVQFEGSGNPRYYIEPATGTLAAVVRDLDAAEGTTFAYMHKWTWLDANKEVRDVLMMLFALGNVVVALLGLWLFARKGG
ncbi:MAG TPA: PepSY domain-containing protein, partial [Methylophilaceae bacterium]|nr:PepSY domain-containing protein [Methylophilaceae bacterium]